MQLRLSLPLLGLAFFLLGKSSSAQCNLEKRSLYGEEGHKRIDSFQKQQAWQLDLNNDRKTDTAIIYQIQETEKGVGFGRYTSQNRAGLVVLAIKQNEKCQSVNYKFVRNLEKFNLSFRKDHFYSTFNSSGAGATVTHKAFFSYNNKTNFPLIRFEKDVTTRRPTDQYSSKYESYTYDYKTKTITFKKHLEKRQTPGEEFSNRYKILASTKISNSNRYPVKVYEEDFVTYQKVNWEGPKDLSFQISSEWGKKQVTIQFNVKDEKIVTENNQGSILKQDHLELWFDFTGIHEVMKNCRRNEKGHYPKEVKNKFRVQILISLDENGKILANYDDKEYEVKGIERNFQTSEDGYQFNLTIPIEFFWNYFNIDYHPSEGQKLGFTAMVSDTDDSKNPQQDCLMGTSQLSYGEPGTIGVLKLVDIWQRPVFEDHDYDF